MTNKYRLKILNKTLKEYEENYIHGFLCLDIGSKLNKALGDCNERTMKIFPELAKYRPKRKNLFGAWWVDASTDVRARHRRIKVLKSLIKEIEAQ